jgi:uncharacterized membrane protein YebE (DUF533 family)
MSVRKWTIPLTLAGLGGLGAMLLSHRVRKLIRSATKGCGAAPERLMAWNDSAQQELNHIQQAVKDVEQLMGTHTAQ